jgi:uncharacterized membrane protein YbhN (UPF0104 family)
MGGGEQEPESQADPQESAALLAAQSRTLRTSLVSLVVFLVIVLGLMLAVPSLRTALDRLSDADPSLLGAAVVLELLSCLGYVVLFGLVFFRLSRSLSSRLSLAELAVNSVVSISGLAGIALGAWVLRSQGYAPDRIAKRSVLLFALTSAVNAAAVVVIGVPMWLGLLPGSTNPLLTLLPAVVALASILATLAAAAWARRAAAQGRLGDGRSAAIFTAIGGGVQDAIKLIGERDWRLLGAVAYWLLDNLALYAALAAFGHSPSVWVVLMAYLVGMIANSIPLPAGFLAVEGGLVGMLVLFGVRPVSVAIAAVLVYRVISLWVPAIIGSIAFASIRREIGKPMAAVQ